MIAVKNLSKYHGERCLFKDVTFHVNDNEVVGLCGENGSGKSTILKILAGIESSDTGEFNCPKGTTFGYLPQDIIMKSEKTLYDEVSEVFEEVIRLKKEAGEIEELFASGNYDEKQYQKLLDRYGDLQEKIMMTDAHTIDAEIHDVLRGLGFLRRHWSKKVSEFSGGWQMKIYMAKLLLEKPDVLLLDEPTNHLDIDARNWLETFLKNYPKSVIIVSHDRHFMDSVVKKIFEIYASKLEVYHGLFSKYLTEREERIDKLYIAYEKQQDEIDKMQEFIDRFRAKIDKAQLVQSRIKTLEKMEKIQLPPRRKKIKFFFPKALPSGEVIVEAFDVAKSYGNLKVFEPLSFTISRGEKIVLLGVNGAGKTTLVKVITQNLKPDSGEARLGHNVKIDYFAQDQAQELNPTNSVLGEVSQNCPMDMAPKLRTLLGTFLFSGDDVNKSVSVLSGGERARLSLAKMLLRQSNFLILDEPTNHLDVLAKDVLKEALMKYDGTVLFVSHDRDFVSNVATRVLEIYDGKLRDYPGTYEEFLEHKLRNNLDADPDDIR